MISTLKVLFLIYIEGLLIVHNFDQLYRDIVTEKSVDIYKIGIFPGAFKPPHTGHYHTALAAMEECDEVHIFVSAKGRALSDQNKNSLTDNVECDSVRYRNLIKQDSPYTTNIFSVQTGECMRMSSASAMRVAIKGQDKHTIFENLPDGVDKEAIFEILMQSNDSSSEAFNYVTIEQTMAIWEHYKDSLMSSVSTAQVDPLTNKKGSDLQLHVSHGSPVKDTYDFVDRINKQEEAGEVSVVLYVGV